MPPDSPTPEEEARLRRLLADARADEPLPADVAARLDAQLAELGQERAGPPTAVAHLHHRRRRAVGLLLAAAVVLVAGVGVAELVQRPDASSESAGALAETDATAREPASGDATAGEAALERNDAETADDGADAGTATSSEETSRPDLPIRVREVQGRLPRVREQRLERDALRVRRGLPRRAVVGENRALLFAPGDFVCPADSWGAGVFAGVRYGSQDAVLAFRTPSEQNQVVEVLQCGTGDVLRSVTVAAPRAR